MKNRRGVRRFVYSFQPYLTVVRDLSSLLLLYMRPYTVETGFMWGLMHLTSYLTKRQGAIKHQETRSRLAVTHAKIQQCLETFSTSRMA
jgi:hypothetical protein